MAICSSYRLRLSIKVCHHPVCTEDNGDLPLLLCRQCESDIHRRPEYSGHLVLDINQRQEEEDGDSDSEDSSSQHITEDQVDGLFVKHNPKIRNKSPSDLERKLKRKKALKKKGSKNGSLEAALAQIADPEGTGLMDVEGYDSSSVQERRDSGLGDFTSGVLAPDLDSPGADPGSSATSGGSAANQRVPVRRQSRIAINSSHFTLKFGGGDGQREDLEVVAAVHNRPTTLREAIESVLESRNLDINNVNVFIEKSRTPLPINSDTVFLAGNTLEIKGEHHKDKVYVVLLVVKLGS
ncbi:pleckstrin domain-containing family G member [Elysia marginata]|uniref:Pleckstrin domain-containing family G member n=1 Tax=Elysia marginata TaxID=1093978 RepID=A0AAV4IVA8_9GAST|nr:pleckstrin domain-containing family G member [Elysia marginata]